jgi:glycosyltransferase involved in cell wall biosynthesis
MQKEETCLPLSANDEQIPPGQNNDLPPKTIALMICGNLFEDFFDTVGISFETFRTDFIGSYQFGYVNALRLANVRTILFYVSARVSTPLRFKHEPTGADVCILPAPAIHHTLRYLQRVAFFQRRVIKSLDSYLVLPLKLLADELRREGCDAVLFQDYENPSFDVCVLLGKLLHLPVFATFQGGTAHRSQIERPLRSRSLQACSGLVIAAQTEALRVRQVYQVAPKKIASIFNPVDVYSWKSLDRDRSRTKFGIPLNAQVVVCHGRIDIGHKGLDILLAAWVQLCQERPDKCLRLLLIGSGQDSERLRRIIAEQEIPGVLWIDEFISDRALIQEYLSTADVYALPSRGEGFPVAPIEAMSCSLPIVATQVSGVPDILERGEASGGLIVPPEDSRALALAISHYLDNPSLAYAVGQNARQRAEQGFTFDVIGQQLRQFMLN